MKLQLFILFFVLFGFIACSVQDKTYIVTGQKESVAEAADDLARYLSATYPRQKFEVVTQPISDSKNILLEIEEDAGWENNEAFKILGEENRLIIKGKTPRAIAYGVFGLLKHLGWNFNLSFQIPPDNPKPLDFLSINLENEPLKERRILFNWHNFISGCTGWNYEHWEQWIDNGFKIGFNTIMVHAYGNNPMHSFTFNGVEKEMGFLSTTQHGRDWGTQHVNDVRLLPGGEIFDHYVFGSRAAMVPDEKRSPAATALMQEVFKHADAKGMGVCFSLDVDVWMANPQNVINTLPEEALIEIDGYNTVNPDHPEGKNYYKAQLTQLFSDYPEITMLTPWIRHPSKNPTQNTIWLLHESGTLPLEWQKEYFEILKNNPDLIDERPYPGLFAVSKIVKVYREILDEIKPEVELSLGSWDLDFPIYADPFIQEDCGFISLVEDNISDNTGLIEGLARVAERRDFHMIVWAQHDSHRIMGRPYIPFPNFNNLLEKINAKGYGIIHWTTHPLDLLFTNYENQVWENTANETWEKSSENFALSMLKNKNKKLVEYYKEWYFNAPMFGRETEDYFFVPGVEYQMEGYTSSLEVVEKAKERLKLLKEVKKSALNRTGLKEYNYHLGLEKFIISFFNNHHNMHQAFQFLKDEKTDEAIQYIKLTHPEETINLFSKTISDFGATRGEEGLLLSMNTRWLPDYICIRQRVGMEPIRINFQPTSHDPLAQKPGNFTYFIDSDKNFWLSLGEKELNTKAATNGQLPLKDINDSWIEIAGETIIPLKTMRNHKLRGGEYDLVLHFVGQNNACKVIVMEGEKEISYFTAGKSGTDAKAKLVTSGSELSIKIIPEGEIVKVAGLMLAFKN